MYLANNTHNHDLHSHSVAVATLAGSAANYLGLSEELRDKAILAGLMHDIGKTSVEFQNFMKSGKEDSKDKNFVCHQELSWAVFDVLSRKNFDDVGQAIYWHHATMFFDKQLASRDNISILEMVGEDNFNRVIDLIRRFDMMDFDLTKYLDLDLSYDDALKKSKKDFPKPYNSGKDTNRIKKDNATRLAIRSCLIYADHTVSEWPLEKLQSYRKDEFDPLDSVPDFRYEIGDTPTTYDSDRFDLQKKIVKQCGNTSLIKAPAGFGKTLLGLIWGSKQRGQIFWVVPRNFVARTVFKNICDELVALGITDVPVELYLTGGRERDYVVNGKHLDPENIPPFSSHIVVTNLDNLLAPMVSKISSDENKITAERMFNIQAGNVVFDEFHEFITDEAMWGAFVSYAYMRNVLCNDAKTLLLSATPSLIHKLIESTDSRVTVLPNDQTHYPAQHNELYDMSFSEEVDVTKQLVMFNSVSNVQDTYQAHQKSGTYIAHSKYTEFDQKRIMSNIFHHFDKNGDRKGQVFSAPVLQAAADISFHSLFKSIESPETDLQTIGRINRWGRNKRAEVVFSVIADDSYKKRETGAISTRYSMAISKKWQAYVQQHLVGELTLQQLYEFYNEFNIANHDVILEFLNERLLASYDQLYKFYPRDTAKQNKNIKEPGEGKIKTTSTLRRWSPSFFIAVRDQNGNWVDEPFQFDAREMKDYISNDKTKNSDYTLYYRQLSTIVDQNGNQAYPDVENVIQPNGRKKKNIKIDLVDLEKRARYNTCPFPVKSLTYDSTLGLLK